MGGLYNQGMLAVVSLVVAVVPGWRLSLSPADKALMLKVARAELMGEKFKVRSENLEFVTGMELFVTLYGERGRSIREMSVGGSLHEQIKECCKKLRENPSFRDLGKFRIKVDIVSGWARSVDSADIVQWVNFIPGVNGIAVPGKRTRYLLPSEPVEKGLTSLKDILKRLKVKKGWRVDIFRTISFVESSEGGQPLDLYRGVPIVRRLTRQLLHRSWLEAGKWFLKNQKKNGSFCYIYYPLSDLCEEEEESLARQTGVVYALYRLYRETGERGFLLCADRALNYILSHKKEREDDSLLAFKGKGWIGVTALLMLGLIERRKGTCSDDYDALLERLGKFILSMMKESGEFYGFVELKTGKRGPEENPSFISTGQSALALVRLYEEFGQKIWLEGARKAIRFLVEERPRKLLASAEHDPIPPDAWLSQALAEIYPIAKSYPLAEHCFVLASRMMAGQFRECGEPDFIGGFIGRPPEVCLAGARAEGLVKVAKLARTMNIPSEVYEEALIRIARFLISNQYTPDNTYFLPNPERAIGGFRKNALELSIRVDYVRHSVVFLIELEELLYGKSEKTAPR